MNRQQREQRAARRIVDASQDAYHELASHYPAAARAFLTLGHATAAVAQKTPGWSAHLGALALPTTRRRPRKKK